MSTVSTETRKYVLKARAESQRETRDRIARAAAELHEQVGVAQTTVAEIARRAGVTRLTVYNHFPDLPSLMPACSAHYLSLHPFPEMEDALGEADPGDRVRAVLALLYGWYRETESMHSKLFADRTSVPELDEFMSGRLDLRLAELADELVAGFRARGRRREQLRTLIRVALDFWTWSRLKKEGLDDEAAAELMSAPVECAAHR